MMSPERVGSLPSGPGVYLFRDRSGQLLYVGKAKNLRRRVSSYFRPLPNRGLRLESLITRTRAIDYEVLGSEDEALLREAELIKAHVPPYNIRLRDGKRYPLLRVSTGRGAAVELVREPRGDGAYYFGPCPRSGDLRQAIETVRRLYTLDEHAFGRGESARLVRARKLRMTRDLAHWLLGTDTRLPERLEREMRRAARAQDFPRAARLKTALDVLGSLALTPPPEPQAHHG